MLNDVEFLEKMWSKIDDVECEEAEKLRVAERNKELRNKTIRDYICLLIVSIGLVLVACYSSAEITEALSLVVIGLVYLYENKNSKVAGLGGV